MAVTLDSATRTNARPARNSFLTRPWLLNKIANGGPEMVVTEYRTPSAVPKGRPIRRFSRVAHWFLPFSAQQYLPGPDSCSAAEASPKREEGAVTSASDPRYCLSACAFSAVNSASLRKVITATLRVR